MNKKSKRITLGLVSALCLLLVVALGFGVTGAWYRARRQATGTIQLDKGILLTVENLDREAATNPQAIASNVVGNLWVLNASGDGVEPLSPKVQDGSDTDAVSTQPGITAAKNVIIPTIAAASGSTEFYAKAKIVYTFKAFGLDNQGHRIVADTVYNAEDLFMTAANTTNILDETSGIFDNQLLFNSSWDDTDMSNGYFMYTGQADRASTAITAGGDATAALAYADGAVALFTAETPANDVSNTSGKTVDVLRIREWTGGDDLVYNGSNYVEFGGPKVYVRVNTTPEAAEPTYTYTTQIEIAQVDVQIIIDVIQAENLTAAALSAWKQAA